MAGMTNPGSGSKTRRGFAARVGACGAIVALAAGCGGSGKSPKPTAGSSSSPSGGTTAGSSGSALSPGDTTGTPALPGGVTPVYPAWTTPVPVYSPKNTAKDLDSWVAPMKAADAAGMQVWIETDLVTPWLAGGPSGPKFIQAISKVTAEAKAVPNIVGVKIADELGKHDSHKINNPDQAMQFLHDVRAALHADDPGKLVMIDIIGTNLGCMPNSTSAATQKCEADDDAYEEVTHLDFIDRVAKSGLVDVMNVTTNMLTQDQYQKGWGKSRGDAEKAAIDEIKHRGWDKQVILNTRKALSWPTPGNIESADQAASMVPDFVDVPIAAGLNAVDVWSWSTIWGKSSLPVHLMSPNYTTNALWTALLDRHKRGDKLYVHYTPTHSEGSLDGDMSHIAQAFTGVFCAAGTG